MCYNAAGGDMKYIIGNWKMNKTRAEAKQFFEEFEGRLSGKEACRIVVCVPFTAIVIADRRFGGEKPKHVIAGAQNLYPAAGGAFTGEVSAGMLVEAGAEYVLCGHSERRTLFNESDEFINQKVRAARAAGLVPVFCVGETLEQREGGQTEQVLGGQLEAGLRGVAGKDAESVIVAYEPVWAIGTGRVATLAQIEETHAFIKVLVRGVLKADVPVLYGGSVNEKNAAEVLAVPGVDGVLVGGASLDAQKFYSIVKSAE